MLGATLMPAGSYGTDVAAKPAIGHPLGETIIARPGLGVQQSEPNGRSQSPGASRCWTLGARHRDDGTIGHPHQSWDVALTDQRLVLLELNFGGDFNLAQLAHGAGVLDDAFAEQMRRRGYRF